MALYSNASSEEKLDILEDLEYFLHQYDNARDFVTVGGLEAIVEGALIDGKNDK